MINQKNGKPKPGFGFVIGILTLIMLLGLVGELHPARAMQELQTTNAVPWAWNDEYTYTPGTTLAADSSRNVLDNDTDDGFPLSLTAVKDSGTTLNLGTYEVLSDGTFTYTPPEPQTPTSPDFTGADAFYYRAYDGETQSNQAMVLLISTRQDNSPPPDGLGLGTCMGADCSFDGGCTASNNKIVSIEVGEVDDICTPEICNPITGVCVKDVGIYDFDVVLDPKAANIYAVGIWIEVNNTTATQSAITGENCYKSYLYPITQIEADVDVAGGLGPFWDLDKYDVCGDIKSADGLLTRTIKDVPITCTDEVLQGEIGAVVTWMSSTSATDNCDFLGTCPSESPKCWGGLAPIEVSNKNVDMALLKESLELNDYYDLQPEGYFDYTITIKNVPYDDPDIIGSDKVCYRSTGYIIEDDLLPYLKVDSIVSAVSNTLEYPDSTSKDLSTELRCVDINGVPTSCDYGSIVQITVQNNLPTMPYREKTQDPWGQRPITYPIPESTCLDQYHTITLKVQYQPPMGEDGYPDVPQNIYNKACVNGFQYDPWGGAQYIDPGTGQLIVGKASGNNCDDDIVITEVDLIYFQGTPQEESVLLEWETASEQYNLGFNLYRATSPSFVNAMKLTSEPIPPASMGGMAGGSYSYVDSYKLDPQATYYYWLEDIDISGGTVKYTLHGPVSVTLADASRIPEEPEPVDFPGRFPVEPGTYQIFLPSILQ